MADLEDYPSDSSDDDYVPGADSGDEEVSDVEEKDDESDGDSGERQVKSQKSKKRKLKNDNSNVRKRKGGIQLEDEAEGEPKDSDAAEAAAHPCNELKENDNSEKEKERVDALWASFMEDVEVKPKLNMKQSTASPTSNGNSISSVGEEKPKKVTVTKVYDFAGEEIRITEQVDINSKEAKLAEIQKVPEKIAEPAVSKDSVSSNFSIVSGVKRPAGLSSVLNKIGGKKKLSTLDKSLLDWKDFKNKEGIDEELTTFNKGKNGYLEKQAFLQRADQRQFEAEKNMRLANRSNR